jgi:hypothetical protein
MPAAPIGIAAFAVILAVLTCALAGGFFAFRHYKKQRGAKGDSVSELTTADPQIPPPAAIAVESEENQPDTMELPGNVTAVDKSE